MRDKDKSQEPVYAMHTEQYDCPFGQYYDSVTRYGAFIEEGGAYEIQNPDTPRQWFQFLVNDRFASAVSNTGKGFTAYRACYQRITRHYSATDYLLRETDGDRGIRITDRESGRSFDLLNDAKGFICTVRPGEIEFTGSAGGIGFTARLFVPNEKPCECWMLRLQNLGKEKRELTVSVSQDWAFFNALVKGAEPDAHLRIEEADGALFVASGARSGFPALSGFFACPGSQAQHFRYEDATPDGKRFTYTRAVLSKSLSLEREAEMLVLSGASEDSNECREIVEELVQPQAAERERTAVRAKWRGLLEAPSCEIGPKNLQYFLNTWLKNQVYLTFRYNRFEVTGYRDVLQDAWGYLLLDPRRAKERILEAVSKMWDDGRCPRQYDIASDFLDTRDFADSPIWLPIAVDAYIRETGDFSILDEQVPYLQSREKSSVEEHIDRSLDYLYHSRGKNQLILMRGGDWLDGLGGIDRYGPATSAWLTMAAFYAQNIMERLYTRRGAAEKAARLRTRSAEYKEIVNRVAWDGAWYVYAFMGDGEAIGSHRSPEGKIYLNPQSWALMTGICDDPARIEKIKRSVAIYLTTPYGPQLLTPPYVYHGGRFGRLNRQRPGTFANGAIYLHAASFQVFAQARSGDKAGALDTFLRLLPNHPDNPDGRRTSEPYCVGNVHYGPYHKRFGMNLYSWFSATPSWLIHAGFEELLGVRAGYDGLLLEPLALEGFESYTVCKRFRGTLYEIRFEQSKDKGIWLDGKKIQSGPVLSTRECAQVLVRF